MFNFGSNIYIVSQDCTKIQDLSDGSENLQKFNMFIDKVGQ